ncbi:unnamed protein product, partial [Timema podura]|nr:unnamed protein product [Timema podura]
MPGMEDNKKEPHFSMVYNRAIDEVWYQRAVEQHEFEPDCFVYSVPFDAAVKPTILHMNKKIKLIIFTTIKYASTVGKATIFLKSVVLKLGSAKLTTHQQLAAKQPVSHNRGTASSVHAPLQLFMFLRDYSSVIR